MLCLKCLFNMSIITEYRVLGMRSFNEEKWWIGIKASLNPCCWQSFIVTRLGDAPLRQCTFWMLVQKMGFQIITFNDSLHIWVNRIEFKSPFCYFVVFINLFRRTRMNGLPPFGSLSLVDKDNQSYLQELHHEKDRLDSSLRHCKRLIEHGNAGLRSIKLFRTLQLLFHIL